MLACRIGRDDGLASSFAEPVAELAGIIGPVGNQPPGHGDASQYRRRADQVVGLSGRQGEGHGAADVVGQGMNLGRPSAARSSDRVFELPPFAPAADRCALTWVESMAVVLTTPLEPDSA